MPFWAILLAHMGHNYGYETLMTELPTYMKQVLHFNLKDVSYSSRYLCIPLLFKFRFAERFSVCSAVFGYVAVLDGHQSCCGLDAYQALLQSYVRP